MHKSASAGSRGLGENKNRGCNQGLPQLWFLFTYLRENMLETPVFQTRVMESGVLGDSQQSSEKTLPVAFLEVRVQRF